MKKHKNILVTLAILILGLAIWWLWTPSVGQVYKPVRKSAPPTANSSVASDHTSTPTNATMSPMHGAPDMVKLPPGKLEDLLNSSELTPEEKDAVRKDPSVGSKVLSFLLERAAANARSIEMYGKVIDQYGQPVPDVKVIGGTLLIISPDASGGNEYATTTDDGGLFSFTGLHGADFGIRLEKPGYEMRVGAVWNVNYKPDPANPLVYNVYKLQGAEPMAHAKFDSRVPYDGTSATFDLLTGKKTDMGDLKITLLRDPLQIRRGVDHFAWGVQIEIVAGGLVEATGTYQYLAPEEGYHPVFEFSQAKDALNWTQEVRKQFYIHTQNGNYGRVDVDLVTDASRPDTGVSIESWINPSGSRNLEYDPAKEIKSQ